MAFAVDLTGSILDRRYRITGLLGRGGMGYVYDAVHVALDQRVAVKVLHPRYAHEERFRERFLQEARAASKIRHRNVVEIKDFGDTPDGSVFFVMEYLGGHDVGELLKEHGALPWARTRNILLQATSALHAAHVNHIIHRDIKPGNCFLTRSEPEGLDDFVKLLDFGIAKVGSDSHADAQSKGLTGTGEVFGTASYMAPEQARGEPLDARSDMYSLGIMAYEMLTGELPFTGINSIHVITRHLNDKPEPLRSWNAEISAVVEALVLRMIAKAPRDRYASMVALERALRAIPETAGTKGRPRTWSLPGGLRALVEEKRGAAGGEVLGPGGGDVVGGVAARVIGGTGTDAERTQLVVPGRPGGAGAKKTVGPGPVAAVVPAAAATTRVEPASIASGSDGPSPPVGSYGEGTNPPPGRGMDGMHPPPGAPVWVETVPSWQPSNPSTGPMGRPGDTGSVVSGQAIEDAGVARAISGRLVVVVGLLVIVVGGASALGTVAFLSERRAGNGRPGASPQGHGQVGGDEARAVVEGDEGSIADVGAPAAGEEKVP